MTSPTTDPYDGLGAAIQELRLERGATRSAVKAAAKISLEYLGKIERGERRPQPDVIKRIATALETTPAELVARARGLRQRDYEGMVPGAAVGAVFGGLVGAPVLGAAIFTAARALRRQHGRQQLLTELELRLDTLSDEELALLVAAMPQRVDASDHPAE